MQRRRKIAPIIPIISKSNGRKTQKDTGDKISRQGHQNIYSL